MNVVNLGRHMKADKYSLLCSSVCCIALQNQLFIICTSYSFTLNFLKHFFSCIPSSVAITCYDVPKYF